MFNLFRRLLGSVLPLLAIAIIAAALSMAATGSVEAATTFIALTISSRFAGRTILVIVVAWLAWFTRRSLLVAAVVSTLAAVRSVGIVIVVSLSIA